MSEKKSITIKKDDLWKYATFLLLAAVIIMGVMLFDAKTTGQVVLDGDHAAQNLVDFASAQGDQLEVIEVEDLGDCFYEVMFSINGDTGTIKVTKDGEFFLFGDLVSMKEEFPEPEPEQIEEIPQEQPSLYSEEDLVKLKEFNDCISENGIVIYGMEWCPACSQLVEMLGGYGVVDSVYVECTEEQQRCAEETQTGYVPEVQLNGEIYEGSRNFQGFSEATGCPVPDLESI